MTKNVTFDLQRSIENRLYKVLKFIKPNNPKKLLLKVLPNLKKIMDDKSISFHVSKQSDFKCKSRLAVQQKQHFCFKFKKMKVLKTLRKFHFSIIAIFAMNFLSNQ